MKHLLFTIAFIGLLGACTNKQENNNDGSKEISKDSTNKVEESKEKNDENAENPEVKETEETTREEP